MWYWSTKDTDKAGRAKVTASLHKPLPGRVNVSPATVDYERELFKRSLAKFGGS